MVLYFSGTGNTEYIAKLIAGGLEDECVNLFDRIRNDDRSPLHSEKTYIICAPIYVCEMPLFLLTYLKSVAFTGNQKVYFIFTSGGYCGSAKVQAKLFAYRKKLKYLGCAEFVMPRNYVANSMYDMDDEEVIRSKISNATRKVNEVVEAIKNENSLNTRHVWLFETLIIAPFARVWTKYRLVSKSFYATDQCVGCRVCERVCPFCSIKGCQSEASMERKMHALHGMHIQMPKKGNRIWPCHAGQNKISIEELYSQPMKDSMRPLKIWQSC